MNIPAHYSDKMSFREQVLYALSLIKGGTISELMVTLIELKGLSTEESVAEWTREAEQELEKMSRDNVIQSSSNERHNRRYAIRE